MDVAELLDLLKRDSDDSAGNGKVETFVAAALREDKSIYTDHFSIHIYERTAGISGIDRRVGLNIGHQRIGICLTSSRADDAHGDGVGKSLRTAERENELALNEFGIVSERKSYEYRRAIEFDYGEIEFWSRADNVSWNWIASGCERTAGTAISLRGGENYLNVFGAFYDVGVGDDEARSVNDKAGANYALAADGDVGGAASIFFDCAEARDGDLNDAGRNFFDESFDGGI